MKKINKQELAASFIDKSLIATQAKHHDKGSLSSRRKVSTEEATSSKKHSAREVLEEVPRRMIGCPHCKKLLYVEDPPSFQAPPTAPAWVQTHFEEMSSSLISQLEFKL
jgi:hypothetical protein